MNSLLAAGHSEAFRNSRDGFFPPGVGGDQKGVNFSGNVATT